MSNNLVFLYAEITGYFLGCLKELDNTKKFYTYVIYLGGKNSDIELYNFTSTKFISKSNFINKNQLLNFCKKNKPQKLLISGFMNRDYLFVSRKFKNRTVRICLFDTIKSKNENLKFYLKKFLYKIYFDKMWGTGKLHFEYALSLGYKSQDIYENFYVAEKIYFNNKVEIRDFKSLNILYIGRLVKEKNILNLVKAVNFLVKDGYDIFLNIIGNGEFINQIDNNERVICHGYMNKIDIIKIAKKSNLFCLPSIYEPWGVVTHEMALLGLPLLISERCGSRSDLLVEGVNGHLFNPSDNKDLIKKIKKFYKYNLEKYRLMSLSSMNISRKFNHKVWIETLNKIR